MSPARTSATPASSTSSRRGASRVDGGATKKLQRIRHASLSDRDAASPEANDRNPASQYSCMYPVRLAGRYTVSQAAANEAAQAAPIASTPPMRARDPDRRAAATSTAPIPASTNTAGAEHHTAAAPRSARATRPRPAGSITRTAARTSAAATRASVMYGLASAE